MLLPVRRDVGVNELLSLVLMVHGMVSAERAESWKDIYEVCVDTKCFIVNLCGRDKKKMVLVRALQINFR